MDYNYHLFQNIIQYSLLLPLTSQIYVVCVKQYCYRIFVQSQLIKCKSFINLRNTENLETRKKILLLITDVGLPRQVLRAILLIYFHLRHQLSHPQVEEKKAINEALAENQLVICLKFAKMYLLLVDIVGIEVYETPGYLIQ